MLPTLRKYYKRSRKLFLHGYQNLMDENKKACDLMLNYNNDLKKAHYLKKWFYEICKQTKYFLQIITFMDWEKILKTVGFQSLKNML